MTLVAVLLPFLVGSAAVQAADTARAPRVAYRARVALDEAARELRGTVEVRYARAAADTGRTILLDAGSTPPEELRIEGATVLGADPASPRVLELAGADAGEGPLVFTVTLAARASDDPSAQASAPRAFTFRGWLPRVLAPRPWPHPLPAEWAVTFDVPDDQVMGATGSPLCGDPGWAAARQPPGAPVTPVGRNDPARLRGAAAPDAPACPPAAPGRRAVTFYAEAAPDFVAVLDPAFRYEEGDILERPVRVLYRRGAERTWGAGVAVRHGESALAWLYEVLDEPASRLYPWPQTTIVQSPDGGSAADPMLVSVPSPDQGALVRELARLYLAAAVSVAAADRAWLDDGLSRYIEDAYLETQGRRGVYRRLERALLDEELDGTARPAVPAAGAPAVAADPRRGEFLFHRLRGLLGDPLTRAALSAYWRAASLGTGDAALFRAIADSVSGRDLGPLLDRWLRDTRLTDYAIAAARRSRLASGGWRTVVEVRNPPAAHVPVLVQVVADSEVVEVPGGGAAPRDTVVVATRTEPLKVLLDPYGRTHDWNVRNGQRSFGLPLFRRAISDSYLDTWFTRRTRRDRLTIGWAPLAWYTDAGGWTLGVRQRTDYLGRFDLDELWLTVGTGAGADGARHDVDARLVLRNPTWLRAPGLTERLDLGRVEGRAFAALAVERAGAHAAGTLWVSWMRTTAMAYLDTARWDDAGTVELAAGARAWTGGRGRLAASVGLVGGHFERWTPGAPAARGEYALATAEVTAVRDLGGMHLRSRAWGGAVLGSAPPRQRRVHVAGADPYGEFADPFVRSRGAPFARSGLPYHTPGLGGLRTYDPALASLHAAGVSGEVEADLARSEGPLVRRLAVALFADAGAADGDVNAGAPGRLALVSDAGVGVRADHRIGATAFQTRFDFPLWVGAPSLARRGQARGERFAYRWSFSFAPAF